MTPFSWFASHLHGASWRERDVQSSRECFSCCKKMPGTGEGLPCCSHKCMLAEVLSKFFAFSTSLCLMCSPDLHLRRCQLKNNCGKASHLWKNIITFITVFLQRLSQPVTQLLSRNGGKRTFEEERRDTAVVVIYVNFARTSSVQRLNWLCKVHPLKYTIAQEMRGTSASIYRWIKAWVKDPYLQKFSMES